MDVLGLPQAQNSTSALAFALRPSATLWSKEKPCARTGHTSPPSPSQVKGTKPGALTKQLPCLQATSLGLGSNPKIVGQAGSHIKPQSRSAGWQP